MSANGEDTFALHVQPQILESSPGVWELLMNGLIYLDVHLFNNIDMLIEALKNKQVLIIIDDLNRANIIGQLISKAISFINNDPIAGAPPIQIICPVWPRHYSYLEQQKHKTAKFAVHFLSAYNESEGEAFIRSQPEEISSAISVSEVRSLIQATSGDPLLLSLYFRGTDGQTMSGNPLTQIIQEFIDEQLIWIEQEKGIARYLLQEALDQLSLFMVKEGNLEPSLPMVRAAIPLAACDYIMHISQQHTLLYFGADNKIVFRHDRVRDLLLSKVVAEQISNTKDLSQVACLSDPYYAELIGQAIAGSEPEVKKLEYFLNVLPLAVYNALLFKEPGTDYYKTIIKLLSKWSGSDTAANTPNLEKWLITSFLLNNDVRAFESISKQLQEEFYYQLARFRQGHLEGAIRYIIQYLPLQLVATDHLQEEIIEHVKKKHYLAIENQLASYLISNTKIDQHRLAFYIMAGYWQSNKLLRDSYILWEKQAATKQEHFSYFFIYAMKSFDEHSSDLVDVLFSYYEQLPETDGEMIPSAIKSTREAIRDMATRIRWTFKAWQIGYFVSLANAGTHRRLILSLLHHEDDPRALALAIDERSAIIRQFPNAMSDDRWRLKNAVPRLSQESQNYLINRWQDTTATREERSTAYSYWSDNTPIAVKRPLLKAIAENDQLHNRANYELMKAGDISVTHAILKRLPAQSWLIEDLHLIWSETVKLKLEEVVLAKTPEDIDKQEVGLLFGALLTKIPQADAQYLLHKCWPKYKGQFAVFQAALFWCSPELKEMAKEVFNSTVDKHELFKYIAISFDINPFGKKVITLERVNSLLPYLHFIEPKTLFFLALSMRRCGMEEMAQQKVLPLLGVEDRQRFVPTTDELVAELRDMLKAQGFQMQLDHGWLDELESRGCDHNRLIEVLKQFSWEEHSLNGLIMLGRCLEKKGKRSDIPLINNYIVEPKTIFNHEQGLVIDFIFSIKRSTLN